MERYFVCNLIVVTFKYSRIQKNIWKHSRIKKLTDQLQKDSHVLPVSTLPRLHLKQNKHIYTKTQN